eukprot:9186623-Pyramimonas_sp.AAC.1
MAARYLNVSMSLENCAAELLEDIFTGHNGINLADWLGMPIAGQTEHVECVEDFHVPAEVDQDMAGTPSDSEAT